MFDDIAHIVAFDEAGELSSLTPLSDRQIAVIAAQYPGISPQYLEFIRKIGIGSTTRGFKIYEPEPASNAENHFSYQAYQSLSHLTLTGRQPVESPFPADAIAVADSGASWWYCLCPSLGQGVFCLDMGGPSFEPESDNFFSFVAATMILGRVSDQ
ncbi:SMI1/KNR4 family protein [Rhizobium etli]|uniref:SMI1/KNR4 family protein n=1 Tax=Rhizobium etli TaxID=29449 RepID=UPI0005718F72|nr:SMI1/KNR4 family protein [Rhizobium sp. IE4771]